MSVQETIVPTTHGYVQDDTMDKRVAYQNFGFFVPFPTSEDDPSVPYNDMANWASWFSDVGITDIWMAPPYKTLAANPFHEGYAACDRYDVGEFPNGANNLIRTKYGNKEQLLNCISTLKQYGVNCLADIVPNQQYLPDMRIYEVTASNQDGSYVSDTNLHNFLYCGYPAGAGKGQEKYGQIKYWDLEHCNGTDPQSMGRYRALADANGKPYTWLFPGMTVYLKSWDDAPYFGWSPSVAQQADPMDATKTVTQANFVIGETTDTYTSITVTNASGVTLTVGYNLLEGTYVPEWFIRECLYYLTAGWGFTIQTHETQGYMSVTDGFVQFVTFTPYALFYDSPVPQYINQTFVEYCCAQINDPSITDLAGVIAWNSAKGGGSPIGKWMTNWALEQPAYNSATEVDSNGNGFAAFQIIKPGDALGSNTYDVNRNVIQYEFLIGTDMDNTRPDVQSEYIHWAGWLLDLGFDGFRVDAADHVNWDLHFLLNDYMYQRFGDDYVNHLTLMECYVNEAYDFLEKANHPAFAMDAPFWGACQSELAWPWTSSNLANVFTESMAWPERITAGATIPPNMSFCQNHDQEQNVVKDFSPRAPLVADGSNADLYDRFDQYDADRKLMNKAHAYRNVPSMYAIMLTNKGTVPIVYYGDLWNGDKTYMTEKTPYFGIISALLKMRKRYVCGDQNVQFYVSNTSTQAGKDLIASIRMGTSRDTGCAVVVGNNPDTFVQISVPMGQNHANQTFRNIIAIGDEYSQTDSNGNLSVWVSGEQSVFFYGYLSVWIPVA